MSAELILIPITNHTYPAVFINIPIPLITEVKQPVHAHSHIYDGP